MNKFIKKAVILITAAMFLSGCATYRFQHGKPPLDKGYVAFRDDRQILEYTIGKDNSVPGIKLAKERFKRRRNVVEDYYKRMGLIQNHFTMTFWEPGIILVKIVGGIFRLPFVAISDYRYGHNSKYREIIDKREAQQDLREAGRVKKLKDKLNVYVQKDLGKEVLIEAPVAKQKIEEAVVTPAQEPPEVANIPEQEALKEIPLSKKEVIESALAKQEAVIEVNPVEQAASEQEVVKREQETQAPPQEIQELPKETSKSEEAVEQKAIEPEQVQAPAVTAPAEEERVVTVPAEGLKAVIIAKPLKGYSPLRVQFDCRKSSSMRGKIIYYSWDFGDGEVSTKPKPVNTYWSTTYGSRYFTATLTVKDNKGNTAISNATIEVMTK